ncbi:aminotransferase class V-fold PLP-dependent enzyme [Tunicatimonas pelagia]|uniref:aminotransferase class V-fold PLP-dependent enzyme n=1 Tax=Tunicatimonas pelagia TaxID=931531 RepID=UPI002665943C|nr:aminotransferase class V-fold PLP-dependent enzyme [Tunicatimonas pelagia]WKN44609.1 aminotransferase class V-fold PLP-dependent enzyme [Tunicatimonas pelagia]
MKNIFFTPGPAELYFTVESHIKKALNEQVPSISHRSAQFQTIFQEAEENLRNLLALPDNYYVFFTGSATEIWERIIQNLVAERSYHFVNGAFSNRFYKIAQELGRSPLAQTAPEGECALVDTGKIPTDVELIAFTQNETSTGAAHPLEDIYQVRNSHPDAIIAVDAVSTLPYVDLDYTQIDTAYFSVQKGFGLPAGLGVWLVNDRCLAKAEQLVQQQSIGSYHSLPSLFAKAQKHQTPETPNVLGIYLLAKVAGDMLTKGMEIIRNETKFKAGMMYQMLSEHPNFTPFVRNEAHRSKTVIVAETQSPSAEIIGTLEQNRLLIGDGYGTFKGKHVRIANFPTHSKEHIILLVDKMSAIL